MISMFVRKARNGILLKRIDKYNFQFVDEWIDKIMNIKQQEVAQMNMVEWLSDSQELGKKPSKIEFVKKFELYEMHYYIFKFKRSVFTS